MRVVKDKLLTTATAARFAAAATAWLAATCNWLCTGRTPVIICFATNNFVPNQSAPDS